MGCKKFVEVLGCLVVGLCGSLRFNGVNKRFIGGLFGLRNTGFEMDLLRDYW